GFVMANAFVDEAYGVTPELVNKLTVEKWFSDRSARADSAWAIVDAVAAVQNLALTLIMNPSTLGRVYDNELRLAADQDALTLPEVFDTVTTQVYAELDADRLDGEYTERNPFISTFRRNLQADLCDRLIKIATGKANVARPIRQLALMELVDLNKQLETLLKGSKKNGLDAYTRSHLMDMQERIKKALDGVYIVE
ncbi:MAG: zinc-dependent metalloprotease, partial [Phycisphaerales bacterium]